MGRLLIALGASLVALVLFSVLLYRIPLAAALVTVASSAVTIAVLVGHLWARERREARG
jgi:hypothetical protein